MSIRADASNPSPLERIASPKFGFDCMDYLSYRYLVPCVSRAASVARGKLLDIGCGNTPYRELFTAVHTYVGCDVAQSSAHRVDALCRADAVSGPMSGPMYWYLHEEPHDHFDARNTSNSFGTARRRES